MNSKPEYTDFPISIRNMVEGTRGALEDEIERRLRALAKGHTDITGADVRIDTVAEGAQNNPLLYRARIVLSVRSKDIVAVEEARDPRQAVKGALSAAERQVREQRTIRRGR